LPEFRTLGYRVASLTYDRVDRLADFATRRAIGFAMLSDPRSTIIRAFGVLNDAYPGHAVAHPIIFVIDRTGVIRHRFSGKHYRERADIDLVLKVLRGRAGG
jgi:peroxiredoxin